MAEQLEVTVRGDNRTQNTAAGISLWRGAAVLYFIELTALQKARFGLRNSLNDIASRALRRWRSPPAIT